MFSSVLFIREECERQGIPVSVLEKRCNFSNGYLNPKKLKKLPYDRALLVAAELNVPVEKLPTGEDQSAEKPLPVGEELDASLVKLLMELSPDEAVKAKAYIQGMIANRK